MASFQRVCVSIGETKGMSGGLGCDMNIEEEGRNWGVVGTRKMVDGGKVHGMGF